MDDYQLDQFCQRHPECDGKCMRCPAFIANQREELGLNDFDENF